jgi:hypothetical protein
MEATQGKLRHQVSILLGMYNLDLHIFHVVEDNCKSNRHIVNPTKKVRIVVINNQQNANTSSLQSKINCHHLRSTELLETKLRGMRR